MGIFDKVLPDLKGRVTGYILEYLGQYLDGLDRNQVKLKLWNGDLSISNVRLNAEAFDELLQDVGGVPWALAWGNVATLHVSVPWSALKKESVVVTLDGVTGVAMPFEGKKWDAEAVRRRRKTAELARWEARRLAGEREKQRRGKDRASPSAAGLSRTSSGGSVSSHDTPKAAPAAAKQKKTWASRLKAAVMENLKIKVQNVHFRYEDCLSTPYSAHAMGVKVDSIGMVTATSSWDETFVLDADEKTAFKLLYLRNFSAYVSPAVPVDACVTGPRSREELATQRYAALAQRASRPTAPGDLVIERFTARVRVELLRDAARRGPADAWLSSSLLTDPLSLAASREQYALLSAVLASRLRGNFHLLPLRPPPFCRPSLGGPGAPDAIRTRKNLGYTADAAAWWRYAIAAVRVQVAKGPAAATTFRQLVASVLDGEAAEAAPAAADVKRYEGLHLKVAAGQPLSGPEQALYTSLQACLPLRALIAGRAAVYARAEPNTEPAADGSEVPQPSRATGNGFLSRFRRPAAKAGAHAGTDEAAPGPASAPGTPVSDYLSETESEDNAPSETELSASVAQHDTWKVTCTVPGVALVLKQVAGFSTETDVVSTVTNLVVDLAGCSTSRVKARASLRSIDVTVPSRNTLLPKLVQASASETEELFELAVERGVDAVTDEPSLALRCHLCPVTLYLDPEALAALKGFFSSAHGTATGTPAPLPQPVVALQSAGAELRDASRRANWSISLDMVAPNFLFTDDPSNPASPVLLVSTGQLLLKEAPDLLASDSWDLRDYNTFSLSFAAAFVKTGCLQEYLETDSLRRQLLSPIVISGLVARDALEDTSGNRPGFVVDCTCEELRVGVSLEDADTVAGLAEGFRRVFEGGAGGGARSSSGAGRSQAVEHRPAGGGPTTSVRFAFSSVFISLKSVDLPTELQASGTLVAWDSAPGKTTVRVQTTGVSGRCTGQQGGSPPDHHVTFLRTSREAGRPPLRIGVVLTPEEPTAVSVACDGIDFCLGLPVIASVDLVYDVAMRFSGGAGVPKTRARPAAEPHDRRETPKGIVTLSLKDVRFWVLERREGEAWDRDRVLIAGQNAKVTITVLPVGASVVASLSGAALSVIFSDEYPEFYEIVSCYHPSTPPMTLRVVTPGPDQLSETDLKPVASLTIEAHHPKIAFFFPQFDSLIELFKVGYFEQLLSIPDKHTAEDASGSRKGPPLVSVKLFHASGLIPTCLTTPTDTMGLHVEVDCFTVENGLSSSKVPDVMVVGESTVKEVVPVHYLATSAGTATPVDGGHCCTWNDVHLSISGASLYSPGSDRLVMLRKTELSILLSDCLALNSSPTSRAGFKVQFSAPTLDVEATETDYATLLQVILWNFLGLKSVKKSEYHEPKFVDLTFDAVRLTLHNRDRSGGPTHELLGGGLRILVGIDCQGDKDVSVTLKSLSVDACTQSPDDSRKTEMLVCEHETGEANDCFASILLRLTNSNLSAMTVALDSLSFRSLPLPWVSLVQFLTCDGARQSLDDPPVPYFIPTLSQSPNLPPAGSPVAQPLDEVEKDQGFVGDFRFKQLSVVFVDVATSADVALACARCFAVRLEHSGSSSRVAASLTEVYVEDARGDGGRVLDSKADEEARDLVSIDFQLQDILPVGALSDDSEDGGELIERRIARSMASVAANGQHVALRKRSLTAILCSFRVLLIKSFWESVADCVIKHPLLEQFSGNGSKASSPAPASPTSDENVPRPAFYVNDISATWYGPTVVIPATFDVPDAIRFSFKSVDVKSMALASGPEASETDGAQLLESLDVSFSSLTLDCTLGGEVHEMLKDNFGSVTVERKTTLSALPHATQIVLPSTLSASAKFPSLILKLQPCVWFFVRTGVLQRNLLRSPPKPTRSALHLGQPLSPSSTNLDVMSNSQFLVRNATNSLPDIRSPVTVHFGDVVSAQDIDTPQDSAFASGRDADPISNMPSALKPRGEHDDDMVGAPLSDKGSSPNLLRDEQTNARAGRIIPAGLLPGCSRNGPVDESEVTERQPGEIDARTGASDVAYQYAGLSLSGACDAVQLILADDTERELVGFRIDRISVVVDERGMEGGPHRSGRVEIASFSIDDYGATAEEGQLRMLRPLQPSSAMLVAAYTNEEISVSLASVACEIDPHRVNKLVESWVNLQRRTPTASRHSPDRPGGPSLFASSPQRLARSPSLLSRGRSGLLERLQTTSSLLPAAHREGRPARDAEGAPKLLVDFTSLAVSVLTEGAEGSTVLAEVRVARSSFVATDDVSGLSATGTLGNVQVLDHTTVPHATEVLGLASASTQSTITFAYKTVREGTDSIYDKTLSLTLHSIKFLYLVPFIRKLQVAVRGSVATAVHRTQMVLRSEARAAAQLALRLTLRIEHPVVHIPKWEYANAGGGPGGYAVKTVESASAAEPSGHGFVCDLGLIRFENFERDRTDYFELHVDDCRVTASTPVTTGVSLLSKPLHASAVGKRDLPFVECALTFTEVSARIAEDTWHQCVKMTTADIHFLTHAFRATDTDRQPGKAADRVPPVSRLSSSLEVSDDGASANQREPTSPGHDGPARSDHSGAAEAVPLLVDFAFECPAISLLAEGDTGFAVQLRTEGNRVALTTGAAGFKGGATVAAITGQVALGQARQVDLWRISNFDARLTREDAEPEGELALSVRADCSVVVVMEAWLKLRNYVAVPLQRAAVGLEVGKRTHTVIVVDQDLSLAADLELGNDVVLLAKASAQNTVTLRGNGHTLRLFPLQGDDARPIHVEDGCVLIISQCVIEQAASGSLDADIKLLGPSAGVLADPLRNKFVARPDLGSPAAACSRSPELVAVRRLERLKTVVAKLTADVSLRAVLRTGDPCARFDQDVEKASSSGSKDLVLSVNASASAHQRREGAWDGRPTSTTGHASAGCVEVFREDRSASLLEKTRLDLFCRGGRTVEAVEAMTGDWSFKVAPSDIASLLSAIRLSSSTAAVEGFRRAPPRPSRPHQPRSPFHFEVAHIPSVTVCLVDDTVTGVALPVIEVQLADACVNYEHPSLLRASVQLLVNHYYQKTCDWESILEQAPIGVTVQNRDGSDDEDAPPVRNISLAAAAGLNVVLSPSGLHCMKRAGELLQSSVERTQPSEAPRGADVPFSANASQRYPTRIENTLPCRIALDSGVGDQGFVGAMQTKSCFCSPVVVLTDPFESSRKQTIDTSKLGITRFQNGLIADVRLRDGFKHLSILTSMTLHNQLKNAVSLMGLGTVEPGGCVSIPDHNLDEKLRMVPRGAAAGAGAQRPSLPFAEIAHNCEARGGAYEIPMLSADNEFFFVTRVARDAAARRTELFVTPAFTVKNLTGAALSIDFLAKIGGDVLFTEVIQPSEATQLSSIDPTQSLYIAVAIGGFKTVVPACVRAERPLDARSPLVGLSPPTPAGLPIWLDLAFPPGGREAHLTCPYWIVNHTRHDLTVAHEAGTVAVPAASEAPVLFAPHYDRQRELMAAVFLAGAKQVVDVRRRNVVPLHVLGADGYLHLEDDRPGRPEAAGSSVCVAFRTVFSEGPQRSRTRVLELLPRVVFVNSSASPLSAATAAGVVELPCNVPVPFDLEHAEPAGKAAAPHPKQNVSFSTGAAGTCAVQVYIVGETVLKLWAPDASRPRYLKCCVTEDTTTFVTLHDTVAPFVFVNRTAYPISVRQVGFPASRASIPAKQTREFGWDNAVHHLEIVLEMFERESAPLDIYSHQDSAQPVLQLAAGDVYCQLNPTKDDRVLEVVVYSDVLLRTAVIRLAEVRRSESSRVTSVKTDVQKVSVSFVRQEERREVACLTVDGLFLQHQTFRGSAQELLQVAVQSTQLDDMTELQPLFPVVLSRETPSSYSSYADPAAKRKPLLSFTALRRLNHSGLLHFQYVGLEVEPVRVSVGDRFLWEMSEFNREVNAVLGLRFAPSRGYPPEYYLHKSRGASGGLSRRLHFDRIELSGFFLTLTVDRLKEGRDPYRDGLGLGNLALALPSVKDSEIKLSKLVLCHGRDSVKLLIHRITKHYVREFEGNLAGLVGRIQAIGNPLGLFSNITTGVKDFFVLPYRALAQSPGDFGTGLMRGTGSLVSRSLGGVLGTVAGVTKGGARVVESLADKDWREQRAADSKGDYIVMESSVKGVFDGVVGLIRDPVLGAVRGGPVGGLVGAGRGLVGAVAKPVSGFLNDVSGGATLLEHTVMLRKTALRVRQPRYYSAGSLQSADITWHEVYENERWYLGLGWTRYLLPDDFPHWSDAVGKAKVSKDTAKLPKGDAWVNAWAVDAGAAGRDGWLHALHFKSTFHPKQHQLDIVRRRRWIRASQHVASTHRASHIPDTSRCPLQTKPFSSAFIELERRVAKKMQHALQKQAVLAQLHVEKIVGGGATDRWVAETTENQRFTHGVGWTSNLSALDPWKWSDRQGTARRPPRDRIVLPPGFSWCAPWDPDGGDRNGWWYSTSFQDTFLPTTGPNRVVRKRHWTRTARKDSAL
ncbi:putative vacuolar protein sorting-associated protein 13C [Diplonema papillatum]|nr:putative vacuolar protein sorting-associated protein 13C [Diplonema papillatum]